MNIKYKKVPNNENVIEIDGKVILSFDLRYKEYLKWRNNNPDLEQQLLSDLKREVKNKKLYNTGAPHKKGNVNTWYTEDGKLKMVAEMKGEICHGVMIHYDKDENILSKETFVDGNLEGKYVYYHEDGTKASEGYMKDGKDDLVKTVYYEGKVQFIETYKDGKLDGLCEYYTLDGQKDRTCYYKDGKKDSRWVYYYSTGYIMKEEFYDRGVSAGKW